jgi:hypothetical protein
MIPCSIRVVAILFLHQAVAFTQAADDAPPQATCKFDTIQTRFKLLLENTAFKIADMWARQGVVGLVLRADASSNRYAAIALHVAGSRLSTSSMDHGLTPDERATLSRVAELVGGDVTLMGELGECSAVVKLRGSAAALADALRSAAEIALRSHVLAESAGFNNTATSGDTIQLPVAEAAIAPGSAISELEAYNSRLDTARSPHSQVPSSTRSLEHVPPHRASSSGKPSPARGSPAQGASPRQEKAPSAHRSLSNAPSLLTKIGIVVFFIVCVLGLWAARSGSGQCIGCCASGVQRRARYKNPARAA